jgi:hypothetical protein
MRRNPRIAVRIKDVATKRVGREIMSRKGDIVTEEFGDLSPQSRRRGD